jgi:hypothetical protein
MMSIFERNSIARALVNTVVGTLPARGERVPIIKGKQRRVLVTKGRFYVDGRVAQVGEVIALAADEAAGLVVRKLAEFAE